MVEWWKAQKDDDKEEEEEEEEEENGVVVVRRVRQRYSVYNNATALKIIHSAHALKSDDRARGDEIGADAV